MLVGQEAWWVFIAIRDFTVGVALDLFSAAETPNRSTTWNRSGTNYPHEVGSCCQRLAVDSQIDVG